MYNLFFYTLLTSRTWYNRIDGKIVVSFRPALFCEFVFVTEHVFLGGVPAWFLFGKLEKLGIKAFVNLMDEFGHLLQAGEIQRRGMTELWIPTPDYLEPRLEDIERAVDFIEKNANNNIVTYVHCKGAFFDNVYRFLFNCNPTKPAKCVLTTLSFSNNLQLQPMSF
jgi:hypothetical protein